MNWDQVEGRWKELKGKAIEKWGELTDDDLDQAAGKREQMAGLLQKKYGDNKADAERKVDDWLRDIE